MSQSPPRGGRGRLIERTGRLAAVLVITGSSILTMSAGPASAAGGGCRPHSNSSFSFDACIGDDGILAYGDVYIKRFTGSNCRVTITVTNGTTSDPPHPCRIGHLGPEVASMSRGTDYYTGVTVTSSAGRLFGISPRSWKP
jgi:hypothetical protein